MNHRLRRSQAQEQRTAERYGAQLSPRSGAGWSRKNDSRNGTRSGTDAGGYLFENKRTDNKSSITLKAKDLEGLRVNAIRTGRTGVLQFDLNGRSYVVLSEEDWDP